VLVVLAEPVIRESALMVEQADSSTLRTAAVAVLVVLEHPKLVASAVLVVVVVRKAVQQVEQVYQVREIMAVADSQQMLLVAAVVAQVLVVTQHLVRAVTVGLQQQTLTQVPLFRTLVVAAVVELHLVVLLEPTQEMVELRQAATLLLIVAAVVVAVLEQTTQATAAQVKL
jgi:hypothetical protein